MSLCKYSWYFSQPTNLTKCWVYFFSSCCLYTIDFSIIVSYFLLLERLYFSLRSCFLLPIVWRFAFMFFFPDCMEIKSILVLLYLCLNRQKKYRLENGSYRKEIDWKNLWSDINDSNIYGFSLNMHRVRLFLLCKNILIVFNNSHRY